tara:strand:- start:6936 stop:7670 length:735 start_codon:yes stop_codon:yes gene_type:complete
MPSINTLCVISARGGSRGVPGKNYLKINGKPLITYAIEKAFALKIFDHIVVSTDSSEISEIAKNSGADVPFTRPEYLSNSTVGKFDVWKHALLNCERIYKKEFDIYVDIDCTNPLITIEDISGTLNKFYKLRENGQSPDAVFNVSHARRNPYFNLVEEDVNGVLHMSKSIGQSPILSRQQAPKVYEHIAGTYVLNADFVKKANHLLDGRSFGYVIADDRAFDIDSELDLVIVEFLMNRTNPIKN